MINFKKIYRNLRYDLPCYFILLITNILPDNVIFLLLRGKLVKPFLGSCGKNLRLGRNITFYNPSNIHFGDDIYIAYGCWFMAGEKIKVHDQVIMGPYCILVTSNHTKEFGSFRFGSSITKNIKIGYGCWLGSRSTILAGCSLGNGVLVASGAVVNKSFGDDFKIGGIPAKVIGE